MSFREEPQRKVILSRAVNPHPKSESDPIFGQKHNPNTNPQFKLWIRIVDFLNFCSILKKILHTKF